MIRSACDWIARCVAIHPMNGFRSGCRCLSNKEWLRITHCDHGQPCHHVYKPGSIMPPGENMRCEYILSSLAAYFLHYGFELFFIEQANNKYGR